MSTTISFYEEDPNTVEVKSYPGEGHPWVNVVLHNGSDAIRVYLPAAFALAVGRALVANFPATEVEPSDEPVATTGPVCDHCGRGVVPSKSRWSEGEWIHEDTGIMIDCKSHGASGGPGYAEVNGSDKVADYEATLAETNVADLL